MRLITTSILTALFALTAIHAQAKGIDTAAGTTDMPFNIEGQKVMSMSKSGLTVTATAIADQPCGYVPGTSPAVPVAIGTLAHDGTGKYLSCQSTTGEPPGIWQSAFGGDQAAGTIASMCQFTVGPGYLADSLLLTSAEFNEPIDPSIIQFAGYIAPPASFTVLLPMKYANFLIHGLQITGQHVCALRAKLFDGSRKFTTPQQILKILIPTHGTEQHLLIQHIHSCV